MEIVIQSQDKPETIAILDFDSGNISIYPKTRAPGNLIQGFFSVQNDIVICLYWVDGNLYFTLDGQKIKFQEADRVQLKTLPNSHCLFSIQRGQEVVFSWEYTPQEIYPPISAMQLVNPMASEEDYDIFVFVHNVINNAERRKKAAHDLINDDERTEWVSNIRRQS
jgi:hypothetical protein